MKNLLLGKVAAVLDHVAAADHAVSMKELREALHLPPPVLSRIVSDLREMGMLEKAGYCTLVPGIGCFRLLDAAHRTTPLYRAAEKVLSPFSSQNNLNILLISAEGKRIFPIFSLMLSPQSPNILWTSGAGIMMLASQEIAAEEAMAFFLARNPKISIEERIIIKREFDAARNSGMLFRIQQLRQWTLSLPFSCRGTPCVLTVFGKVPEKFDNMLFEVECRRLTTRIITAAKEFCRNEK